MFNYDEKKKEINYIPQVRDAICQIILKSLTLDLTLVEPSGPNIQTRIYTSEATRKRERFLPAIKSFKKKKKAVFNTSNGNNFKHVCVKRQHNK